MVGGVLQASFKRLIAKLNRAPLLIPDSGQVFIVFVVVGSGPKVSQ
jgi:hypothetical protein